MAAGKKTTAKVEALNEALDTKAAASEQAEAIEKEETVKSEAAPKKAAKTEAPASKKTVKSEVAAVKKAVEKKAADVKKAVEKDADTKKTVGRKPGSGRKTAVQKAELQSSVVLQFGGSEYTQDDLMKIAKDVWQHDLNQKADDLTSVELYVKPEEHAVYYVMNKELTGSFYI